MDHPRPLDAHERLHHGSDEERSVVMKRRDAVRLLAVAPLTAAFRWAPESVREASARARDALARGTSYEPKQFTAHEWDTVRVLVDLIIPNDERSGSATEAGVPEFMDFMLGDDPELQTPVRGVLAWLDHECDDRYGKTFVACTAGERGAVLDAIARPAQAKPAHAVGVAVFNRFRHLTASGVFSTRMGG